MQIEYAGVESSYWGIGAAAAHCVNTAHPEKHCDETVVPAAVGWRFNGECVQSLSDGAGDNAAGLQADRGGCRCPWKWGGNEVCFHQPIEQPDNSCIFPGKTPTPFDGMTVQNLIFKPLVRGSCGLALLAGLASTHASTNNIALSATASTSYVSPWENLLAIQDGFEPANSFDHSHGAYGNWPTTGTNWVEYQWSDLDWPLGINTDKIAVYWWRDNTSTDEVGIHIPSASWLEYWNGNSYVPVPHAVGLGLALDQYNVTTFDSIRTDRLRLKFTSSGAASTGILEWKVFGDGAALEPALLHAAARPGNQLELSWQDPTAEYVLERATQAGAAWSTDGLPAPTLLGGTNFVTVSVSGDAAFFRLHSRNDFLLQLEQSSLVVTQGLANTVTVTVGASGNHPQTVSLSASNLPNGLACEFHPATLKGGTSLLTLIASATVSPGTYPVTVWGQGSLSTHAANLSVTVVAGDPAAPYVWPKYNPDLNYNFTNEFAAIPPPTNVLDDCSGVTTTITLPNNWFCFRFGDGKNSLVTSNAWIPMLQKLNADFAYFRDVMGWPPDKRAKRGYHSAIYLLGSGTCVGGQSNDLGGWQGNINYNGEDWPMGLLSYYPVYSFDPACPYGDKVAQQEACTHEMIHSVLADMPGCKQACWFQEGGNTWLQGEAAARKTSNYSSMGFLSAGQMIAPFMPVECYSGWLQDDSFGGPCAEGVNRFSNNVQICTWRNLLGGNQYGEAFPHFMGEIVSEGSVAWIWRYCTNRVLEGLARAPEGLGEYQTRRLIKEFRARQVFCDFGKWSNAYKTLLNNNWGLTIDQEWSPYWIDCPAWTARCYVVTTNNAGTLTPEWRTLPGWSGANQIPLTTSNATGNVTVNFTPLGTNMSCQLVYRATDNSVIYSQPVSGGACSLTPPAGKAIKNNVMIAVICNTDFLYNGESSRTNKFDYRLKITGTGTAGVTGPANIATKWYQ